MKIFQISLLSLTSHIKNVYKKMMHTDIKFSKNVLLMDVSLLSNEVARVRRTLSKELKRELPLIDLPKWLVCLALDGDVLRVEGDVQVILVHRHPDEQLPEVAQPDFLKRDGMAFYVPSVGEFSISCVHPAGFTEPHSLYFDLMQLLLDAADVANLMLVYSEEDYQASVREELDKLVKEKGAAAAEKACLYRILSAPAEVSCRQKDMVPSLAHVFEIKPEEIG